MVAEVSPDYPSQWAAIAAVAQKLGIGTAETLRKWVRRAEIDDGRRPALTREEHAETKRLKRENAELRRANEILPGRSTAIQVVPATCAANNWSRRATPSLSSMLPEATRYPDRSLGRTRLLT